MLLQVERLIIENYGRQNKTNCKKDIKQKFGCKTLDVHIKNATSLYSLKDEKFCHNENIHSSIKSHDSISDGQFHSI